MVTKGLGSGVLHCPPVLGFSKGPGVSRLPAVDTEF